MIEIKPKIKVEKSKIEMKFKIDNLDNPIRDIDSNFIVNKLESKIKERDQLLK